MSIEIKLPDLGDNIESGTITNIFVSVGDKIEQEQALLELETDKAVVEVPSSDGGTVKKIHVKKGDEIKEGQVILELESSGNGKPDKQDAKQLSEGKPKTTQKEPVKEKSEAKQNAVKDKKEAKSAAKSSENIDFKIPNMGDNVDSGTVSSILVKVGDSVEVDQGLVELETDKAVVEVPSDIKGVIKEILIKSGDTVKVDQKIMIIETLGAIAESVPDTPTETEPEKPVAKPMEPETQPETPAPKSAIQKTIPSQSKIVPAAPSVRRFAREIGVSIYEVPGTGPGGRISIDDVKAFSKKLHQQSSGNAITGTSVQAEALPDFSKYGEIKTEPLNKLRQTSANHLSYAWATIPHVTQFDKADITHLEKLRKANSKKAEAVDGKLTMTAILVKVIEAALRKFQEFNASIDMANKQIIYKKYYNISIAVDTDRGLLVPVIKDVDSKNIIDVAVELAEIAQKARDKKLTMEEMSGGNFSISNLGGIGGTGFTPIVHSPDVAILGVSRAEMTPVFVDGEFQPRLMMPLALSYDHRIIDGAAAARFLRWVCQVLEEPFNVLLEG